MKSTQDIQPAARKSSVISLTPANIVRRALAFVSSPHKVTAANTKRLEKQIKDFAGGGLALMAQRQGIYLGALILCAFFFSFKIALACYLFCQIADGLDTWVSLRVMKWNDGSPRQAHRFYYQLLATSTLSALSVSVFVLLVARLEGAGNHFTSLFFLFAGGLFAAVNNHQLPKVLAVRLVMYGAVFLYIPINDIIVERPPLKSELYMHLATVVFVLYFVLECSMIFLRLYQKGLDQYEELRIERDRAQEVYELKSQFVSVVSHELRTPLTSIIGAVGLMKNMDVANNQEGYAKILGIADKNSKRLSTLINDLLDLQKIESDEVRYNLAEIDPSEIARDCVDAISAHAQSRGVTVQLGDMVPDLTICVDRDRMVQVLDNLLSNAIKFSKEGGVVEVSLARDGDKAIFKVSDHGIGIPEKSQDVVFGKFSQIDASDHRAHEGTGLGLSIVKEIVEAHHGQIGYDSKLGVGTTFHVSLPLVAERAG